MLGMSQQMRDNLISWLKDYAFKIWGQSEERKKVLKTIEMLESAELIGWVTEDLDTENVVTTFDKKVADHWRNIGYGVLPLYSLTGPLIPKGWRIVPEEPTDDQISAGADASDTYRVDVMRSYEAMVFAAPSQIYDYVGGASMQEELELPSDTCKHYRDSPIVQYTPDCAVEFGRRLHSVHPDDIHGDYCQYCGREIEIKEYTTHPGLYDEDD